MAGVEGRGELRAFLQDCAVFECCGAFVFQFLRLVEGYGGF